MLSSIYLATVLLLSISSCFLVYKIIWEQFLSPLRHFPGPILAKFTDIYRAFAVLPGTIDQTNIKWHRKYGTAVRIGPNTISISDPSLIKTIYATKNPWRKSDMYKPNDVVIQGKRVGNLFNTPDAAWHEKYSKPIRNFWTMHKVLEVESYIDQTVDAFIQKLGAKFADKVDDKPICMIDDWLAWFSWDVIANSTFGQPYGFLDQERDVQDLIYTSTIGLYYFAIVSQIPWIDHFLDKNPIVQIGPKPLFFAAQYATKAVAEYQQNISVGEKSGDANHFLARYLKLKDEYPDVVDDNCIVNYLIGNVSAGGDTTAAIMRAVTYHLAKHPKAYEGLISELDSANLALPAQWKDIRNLPYLDAVIRESMRISPGISMIFERVVPHGGFTFPDGRFIPAGTVVGISPAVTNHDYKIFGHDADSFNPDRWLRRAEESEEEFDTRRRQMLSVVDFGFGAGSRICMGRNLAMLEIWKAIATLYTVFDDPEHKWKCYDAWFVYQWDMPMVISRR
ncbi:benzoate 4-monooxygenase cytochrome P450 protein [Rutstroemia sp. NJR-2017a BBW]|nr:benzoate 4-monooxygenase cytochrome P450 protein [Rutstroemia sp. NJR-2017a BBW]